ncbi:MAG: hypothetical protein RLZZ253_684 [Verrucomicrobiota bacterium]|jgi:hypothetical protein
MSYPLKFLIPAALLFSGLQPLGAQGGKPAPIQASTKVFPDNSVSTTLVNLETRSAEETLRTASGKVLRRTLYDLDARGQSTAATFFDSKDQIRYKETYVRDSSDRVVESKLFSATNTPLGRRVFHYDSKGKVRVDDYDAAGKLMVPAKNAGKKP